MTSLLRPFLEVCDVQGGTQPPKSEFVHAESEGYIRLLQIQDFNNDNKAVYIPQSNKLKTCNLDDVLIGRYGASIGRILRGKTGAYNVAIVKTIPNPSFLDNNYLFHFLNSSVFKSFISTVSGRAAQAGFNKSDLSRLQIPLPPLPEQRRIAAILDKADAIRRKRQLAIEKCEDFLRSVFLDMFGDPVTNPNAWATAPLDEIAFIQSGLAKGRRLEPESVVRVPYMRVANVQDGHLDLAEIKYIEVKPSEIQRYLLQPGDILLTEGGDPDKLGRGAIWRGQIAKCIHQNHIFSVRPMDERVVPEYLCALIGSEYGKRYFLKAAKQTTGIASINKSQLKKFPALTPPVETQKKYSEVIGRTQVLRDRFLNFQAITDSLFSSLTCYAFRGELTNQTADNLLKEAATG